MLSLMLRRQLPLRLLITRADTPLLPPRCYAIRRAVDYTLPRYARYISSYAARRCAKARRLFVDVDCR